MSSTPSPKKKYSGRDDYQKTDKSASVGVQDAGVKYIPVGEHTEIFKLACMAIKDSEKSQIVGRLSPESRKIFAKTKWSESGFIPSFTETDKILRKVSRRTYGKTHGR